MKKEVVIWFVCFILLSVVMHFDEWMSDSVAHMLKLETSGAYGLGFLHPIIFTSMVYFMIVIPKLIIRAFKNKIFY